MIRNIILDMGNVLLSYEPETYADRLCSKEAAPIVLKELFLGPDWPKQDLGIIGREEIYDLVKARVPAEYHDDLKKAVWGWSKLMREVPGAKDFIREMRDAGYHIYVLSNAGKEFYEYFPAHYELSLFDGMVVSCDEHVRKPDPAIYEILLTRYGLDPSECLFADDMPVNVEAAEEAGIKGFVFTGDSNFTIFNIRKI